jgi:hypothetical protein
MMEKRKTPRERMFLRGFVRLGDQNYSTACVVRDISEAGARLRFKFPISFAGNVELHIPERQRIFQASVVWTENYEVGLSFRAPVRAVDPIPTADPGDAELSDRLARLEAEITALKQMLAHREARRDNKAKVA